VSPERPSFAFISLIRDEVDARGLAALLESLASTTAGVTAVFLTPDVRGRDFFASTASRAGIDRWWRRNVPAEAVPVFLLGHEEGLADCLVGLEGVVLIAAERRHAPQYASWTVVEAGPQAAPLALAESAILRFSRGGDPRQAGTDIFDQRDARMVANVRASPPSPSPGRPHLPPLLDVGQDDPYSPAARVSDPADPFDLLVAESSRAESPRPRAPARPSPEPTTWSTRARPRLPRFPTRTRGTPAADAGLAARLVERSPILVVVGSRKGGVGKTSHAAGIAIVAGSVLDSVGHRAAILDANVANPDAWGQLALPPGAATVREVVTALSAGREPPAPVHAVTPALACFPERRDGAEYSRSDVRRLAAHLRSRYAFVIVDMSNRLPDPTSGPEAAVAAFWLEEADALCCPPPPAGRTSTASSTTSTFRGCHPRWCPASSRPPVATAATR